MKILFITRNKLLVNLMEFFLSNNLDITKNHLQFADCLSLDNNTLLENINIIIIELHASLTTCPFLNLSELILNYPKIEFAIYTNEYKPYINKIVDQINISRYIYGEHSLEYIMGILRESNVNNTITDISSVVCDYKLTNSEYIILTYLVQGETRKEICNKIHISKRTLENHISNIYSKLNVHNNVEVITKCISEGIIFI